MNSLFNRLNLGGSVLAILAVSSFAAMAQTAAAPSDEDALATVVVTGTNIRGGTAIGSNVIDVNAADLEATGQNNLGDMLHSVPALTNFGQYNQSGQNAPNIHQLGQSASTSTLTVLDGFRIPVGGTSHSLPDPSIVPTNAIQRVDVLADGSSSIYGSDAVAGVVNIITRSTYDGLELSAQGGGGNNYDRLSAGVLWGANWANGNAMMAYQHSYLSDIPNRSRFTTQNYTASGFGNFDSFNCNPATVQINGTGNIYLSPQSATNVSSATQNSPCYTPQGNYQPKATRDNAIAKMTEHFGNHFTLSATMLYSTYESVTSTPAGTLTATAFGSGAQKNPFYTNPTDPTVSTATKQTIRYDFNGLLPPGVSPSGHDDLYGHVEAEYNIDDNWVVTATAVAAKDNSFSYTYNGLCAACASLALNGTAQTSGSTTTADVFGTTLINLQLPLTTANALDVWHPLGSTNGTSAATIAALTSGFSGTTAVNSFEQYRVNISGSPFDLPAGPVKIAVGGEIYTNSLVQSVAKTNSTGPASYGSGYSVFHFARGVDAVFGEIEIPVVSPEMNIPLVKKLDLGISGRYDNYSDVGKTSNPKFAASWQVTDDVKARATYSTSFVAPQLDSIGDPSQNYRAAYGGAGGDQVLLTFPTALYPGTAGVLPGCAAGAVTCQIGSASTPGFKEQRGIGPNAKPQTGDGYTFGIDFTPTFLPGLSASVTYWTSNFKGAVTSENGSVYANVASLGQYFQIFPHGIANNSPFVLQQIAPFPTLNNAIQPTVYYFYGDDQLNIFNLYSAGLDFDVRYTYDAGDYGVFQVGTSGTEFTREDESFGYPAHGEVFSVLNTNGFNSLFPNVQFQSRSNIGWSMAGFAAQLFVNWTGGYRNWNNPIAPINHDAAGNPVSGGDIVAANTTVDLHLSYVMPDGFLTGDEVFITGTNIFNTSPPFYNVASGFDSSVANKVGRVVQIGLKAKF